MSKTRKIKFLERFANLLQEYNAIKQHVEQTKEDMRKAYEKSR